MIETIMAGAQLYSQMEGDGMFGGGKGFDSSSAISGGPWYQGDFNYNSDDITKYAMLGVIVLLIILFAKGK